MKMDDQAVFMEEKWWSVDYLLYSGAGGKLQGHFS
jgi:hypothetical protein